jgi:Flp pilus assembly pilin Flp
VDALIFHGRNFPSVAVLSRLCGPPSGDLTVCDLGRTIFSEPSKPAVHFVERFFSVVHVASQVSSGGSKVNKFLQTLWCNQQGQDIAEYAVMLAVILVLVVGTIRLVGSNANNVFSSVASSVH